MSTCVLMSIDFYFGINAKSQSDNYSLGAKLRFDFNRNCPRELLSYQRPSVNCCLINDLQWRFRKILQLWFREDQTGKCSPTFVAQTNLRLSSCVLSSLTSQFVASRPLETKSRHNICVKLSKWAPFKNHGTLNSYDINAEVN